MKNHLIVLLWIIPLALVFMIGACAAEGTTGTGLNITREETPVIQTAPSEAVQGEGTALVDDIPPYDGAVGPGSPLYGLKIAFEDLDESFTFNETERLNKQMNAARLRLSEVKRELLINNTDAAGRALEIYGQKTNATQLRLAVMASSNTTGLIHAQEMVTKHQAVLAALLLSHPNNTGLARAYNNSLALERKFEEKTQMRFERVVEKNNRTIVKAVRLAVKEQERTENTGQNQTVQTRQTNTVRQGEGNGKDNGKGGRVTQSAAETSAPAPDTTAEPAGTADTGKGRPDNAGNGSGNTKVTGNGNGGDSASDNRGQGNGKEK